MPPLTEIFTWVTGLMRAIRDYFAFSFSYAHTPLPFVCLLDVVFDSGACAGGGYTGLDSAHRCVPTPGQSLPRFSSEIKRSKGRHYFFLGGCCLSASLSLFNLWVVPAPSSNGPECTPPPLCALPARVSSRNSVVWPRPARTARASRARVSTVTPRWPTQTTHGNSSCLAAAEAR